MRASFALTTVSLVCAQDLFLKQEVSVTGKHDCVKACVATDKSKHFKNCNHDASSDCSSSKCCAQAGTTCFTKNKYYSACATKCKPNVPDSRGETWDCTPKSASKCSTLKPCMEKCFKSSELALAANASEKWDCSAYADAAECIAAHAKTPDATLNKMWTGICNDNCAATPASKCPTSSLTTCVQSCSSKALTATKTCNDFEYHKCASTCATEC